MMRMHDPVASPVGGVLLDNGCIVCKRCAGRSCVSNVPIFSTLSDAEQEWIHSLIIRRKYRKGEFLLMEGDIQESLIILHSGKVKVFRYTQDDKEQILYILSEGDFFGERNLFQKLKSACFIEALEETEVCLISGNAFLAFLKKHPETSVKMLEEMSRRMERLEYALQNMGTKSSESRVTSVLVDFAAQFGKPQNDGILLELPLSREGIANYIGITRETVSRKLGLLQDEGLIEPIGNKKVLIPDLRKLEESIQGT